MTDIPVNKLELAEMKDAQLRNSIEEDLKQFKRLRIAFPELSDAELAYRMAMPVKQLKKVRKLLGE